MPVKSDRTSSLRLKSLSLLSRHLWHQERHHYAKKNYKNAVTNSTKWLSFTSKVASRSPSSTPICTGGSAMRSRSSTSSSTLQAKASSTLIICSPTSLTQFSRSEITQLLKWSSKSKTMPTYLQRLKRTWRVPTTVSGSPTIVPSRYLLCFSFFNFF